METKLYFYEVRSNITKHEAEYVVHTWRFTKFSKLGTVNNAKTVFWLSFLGNNIYLSLSNICLSMVL